PSVEVGPYAVIDGACEIAAGCRVEAHAQLVGKVIVGAGTVIGHGAVVGAQPQDLSFDPATDSGVILGEKNTLREHVTIHRGAKSGGMTRVGDGNFIMVGAHLAHDVVLGNNNVLANGVLLAGHVHVGANAFLGGGAVFHQFLRVGDACIVQGNSSFSKDVPPYCIGSQLNQIIGLNVVGLRRQGFSAEERASIKRLFQLLFCSGKNLPAAISEALATSWPDKAARLLDFVRAPSKKGVCRARAGRGDD
ncbi:MAG: acyl-ACP--UDP-N-acetylglucosamine O-acyltransferase, partial [Verrucomicrobiaceae bacterium]|nr:acyl-ACP--UDP-N-acetylglucosamine O-acyltransferase [Verrucomicrobiaceae bacterium]